MINVRIFLCLYQFKEAKMELQTETISKLQDQLFSIGQPSQKPNQCTGALFQPLKNPFIHELRIIGQNAGPYF